jgi:hypothetical protein
MTRAEARQGILEAFIGALLADWIDLDFGDLYGGDFSDLLEKHGMRSPHPATVKDCWSEWGREVGIELGEPVWDFRPEIWELVESAREGGSNEKHL